jgi:hypothetical protein
LTNGLNDLSRPGHSLLCRTGRWKTQGASAETPERKDLDRKASETDLSGSACRYASQRYG